MLCRVHPVLNRLAQSYRQGLGSSLLRAAIAALLMALVVAAHLARVGTPSFRLGAACVLVLALVLPAVRFARARQSLSSPPRVIRSVLLPSQPELGARALRALNRVDRDVDHPGESTELAQLHYERLLERASHDAVASLGKRRARTLRQLAVVVLGAVALAVAYAPLRVVEGLDVLAAQDGRAPVDMRWLLYPRVDGQPPAYLRQPTSQLAMDSAAALPEGTELSVRGRPLHADRQLVLTDGDQQVDFVADGSGNLVAHWTLKDTVELRVAAKFGEVLIYEPRRVQIHAEQDRVPFVKLRGAPAEHALDKLDKLELRWSAIDDHSLSHVDLVLRSGGREERRTLERYPGDQRQGSGGYVLYPHDPFFKRVFLPVTVRIEARDNDALQGSKWGRSEAIVLRPPTVGAPQAARYQALQGVRDSLVDWLGQRLTLEEESDPAQRRQLRKELDEKLIELQSESLAQLGEGYLGLEVPRGWVSFATGQLEQLRRTSARRRGELEGTEKTTLAIDSPLGALAYRDAQSVAKQLGDVAEEAAFGARQAQELEKRGDGVERLDAAIDVLRKGAKQLQTLGRLGADLGSVALSDLDRVVRSREQSDWMHAELAALHLAARLHRPNPSYGAKGGGGTESGGGRSGGQGTDAQGEASQADSDFNRMAEELARLAQEHRDAVDRTATTMDSAENQIDNSELSDEARRRAAELREAAAGLPQPGERPGTGRAAAALSREHAGAMAHDLERLTFKEALESGRRARTAAEDAQRRGVDPSTRRRLEETSQQLDQQIAWAQQQIERIQQLKQQAAKEPLSEIAQLERELGARARRLARETEGAAVLPQEVRERLATAERLMDQAARRLSEGDGDQGLRLQRDAQRLLEESETGQVAGENDHQQGAGGDEAGKHRSGTGGDVPDPEEQNGAEDFRRRVLEGLGKRKGGRLSKAVRRYAEGLLR